MIPAPYESDEARRLASLRSLQILDTPPEERFDRLTRLACRIFDVPISLVSLIDDKRQWFKSRSGLAVCETPREISFCDHAIKGPEIFEVNDACEDPRFKDNPLVTGAPNIRFYAGSPLRSIEGHMLGTFCIIDSNPGKLSDNDRETLKDLALIAERELLALQMTSFDELTGLSNRRGFAALAGKSLKYCLRNARDAVVLFFDLDDFKSINDRYGHLEGDKALQVFANKLQDTFRESDICARLGGDEFVVLLADADEHQARELEARFRHELNEYNQYSGNPYQLSFSCGVTQYNRFKHGNIEKLIEEADQLMYANKTGLSRR